MLSARHMTRPSHGSRVHKIHWAAISTAQSRFSIGNAPVKTIGATVSIGNGPSVSCKHSWEFSSYGSDRNDIEDFLARQELIDQSGTTFGDPGPFQDSAICMGQVKNCSDHLNVNITWYDKYVSILPNLVYYWHVESLF